MVFVLGAYAKAAFAFGFFLVKLTAGLLWWP
jgi:hypothetical protein